ncbi:hypothetical protein PAMA_008553 [Pampus argenteus]
MASPEPPIRGAYGEIITDGKSQKYCDQVKSEVEEKTGKEYTEYVAVQYRIEPAGGRNFLIKVHVGGDNYLHMIVYEPPPYVGGCYTLKRVQEKKDDPLEPF